MAIMAPYGFDVAGARGRLQLHTSLPPMASFRDSGLRVAPYASRRRPGELALYTSRAEHARAHRLAAERNRRNRRGARKGRPVFGNVRAPSVMWTMSIDTSGLTAAFAHAGRAVRRLTESLTSSVRTQLEDGSLNQLLRLYAGSVADETSGPDTDYCASTGGSWSDLMSRIDELTEET